MNDIFTTNQYKALEVMHNNTLTIADKEYCLSDKARLQRSWGVQELL